MSIEAICLVDASGSGNSVDCELPTIDQDDFEDTANEHLAEQAIRVLDLAMVQQSSRDKPVRNYHI